MQMQMHPGWGWDLVMVSSSSNISQLLHHRNKAAISILISAIAAPAAQIDPNRGGSGTISSGSTVSS
ncbi:hypothetical protein PG994_004951 [Apiospora phragmitis]|uniref:Uncharacterized protein n=1 Tax=Apiospora phragmitis TaxID=2905665 RepID=A0ABR1VSA2_9PEZI